MAGGRTSIPGLFPVRRRNLGARTADLLKRSILAGELPSGARLPTERELAETLNVSRTVLREALSRLMADGIVARTAPRSLCVAEFDRARVAAGLADVEDGMTRRELAELRLIVEVGAMEIVAGRVTAAQLAELERWVVEIERRAATSGTLQHADLQFHATLIRAVGNPLLGALIPLVEDDMRQSVLADPTMLSAPGTEARRVARQHREIFEALRAGDAERARRVMIAHLAPYLRGGRPG